MNNFKVGDECWFFYTSYGVGRWHEDDTVIYPIETELISGKIVSINENKDTVHVYIAGDKTILDAGYTFFHEWYFKSKQEAIDAMTKRMQELKNE